MRWCSRHRCHLLFLARQPPPRLLSPPTLSLLNLRPFRPVLSAPPIPSTPHADSRIVLAEAEHLHERIRKLEVALSQERARNTKDPHPLLVETDWFTTEDGAGPSRFEATPDLNLDAAAGAFGTLKIGTEGEAHFIGSFAGSEYLRGEDGGSDPSTPSEVMRDPTYFEPSPSRAAYAESALRLHDAFITGGVGVAGAAGADYNIDALRNDLPNWEMEAEKILESYWNNVNWMYQPVTKAMFERDYIANAYDMSARPHPHKLACVYFALAIGVMFDLTREAWDERGAQFFFCGRACLGLVGLEHASPATVLALHLMGTYIMNDKLGNSADVFWPILGAATKVAQSVSHQADGYRLTIFSSASTVTAGSSASRRTRSKNAACSTGRS